MTTSKEHCPSCNSELVLTEKDKETVFKDITIKYKDIVYICPECGLEIGTIEQTANLQKIISDAYRKEVGLLTGEQIREKRTRLNLSQKGLADKLGIGIASIKRWEGGIIQSKSMDMLLRKELWDIEQHNNYTGNRTFSIPRIKLVIKHIESLLHRSLLIEGDRMLFAAKYLWYADFLCYREMKISMTGATYAALPYGPQLNNYSELLDRIKKADEGAAEPLQAEEKRILKKLVEVYPDPQKVYDASHLEIIWRRRPIGDIIPYSDSSELQGL